MVPRNLKDERRRTMRTPLRPEVLLQTTVTTQQETLEPQREVEVCGTEVSLNLLVCLVCAGTDWSPWQRTASAHGANALSDIHTTLT